MSIVRELKRRNVFKVGIAYLIAAWLIAQVAQLALESFGTPDWVIKTVLFLLVIGFPLALIFAWAFELTPEGLKQERDVPRSESATELAGRKLDFTIIAALVMALAYFAYDNLVVDSEYEKRSDAASTQGEKGSEYSLPGSPTAPSPLVIMMDSHHPSRVYDEETRVSGGTNADVVSDILLDLPIRRQKEAVSPEWHRDEEILGFRPDLVIIHFSAFRHGYDEGPRKRFRLFMEYLADSETEFLIYGRWEEEELQKNVEELLSRLYNDQPGLQKRVHVFGLLDHGGPRWGDPATAASFKLYVKRILAIK